MSNLSPDDEELAVLFHAALLGRTDVLTKVIADIRDRLVDADKIAKFISTPRDDDGCTAMHIASACGHSDVLRALLQHGIDSSIKAKSGDYQGKKAYELANDTTRKTFHVSLFEQVALGNIKNISRLLAGGVPVDIQDGSKLNDTPIHWASSFGNVEVVEQLIANGCDVNIRNDQGQTALHYACKSSNESLVKLLLDEGADISIADLSNIKPADISSPTITEIIHVVVEPTFQFKNAYLEKLKSQEAQVVEDDIEDPMIENHQNANGYGDNNHVGLHMMDDVFDEKKPHIMEPDHPSRPLLVLWPPPQRQKYLTDSPLELSTSSSLTLCVADPQIDIFPLMTWSGLMDVLDRLGFQTQAKRSVTGSKIRLSIDKYVCPGDERYEIIITSERVSITASNHTSLLYAVQMFTQMLQLQSLIKTSHGVTTITLPAISIHDWPDIPRRGVLWCYRSNARLVSYQMREAVELFSTLRINTLYLAIDTDDVASTASMPHPSNEDKVMIESAPTAKIYALDEVCKRNHIELIPTLMISSILQALPTEASKNFSQTMIAIYFLFDYKSVMAELKRGSHADGTILHHEDILSSAYDSCERLMKQLLSVGFRTVMLTCGQWVQQHVDPASIAVRLGLHVQTMNLNESLPSSLFLKPMVDMKQYVESIISYMNDLSQGSASMSIIPAFIDNDFFYPMLLIKFYCLIYGGFAWNRYSSADILSIDIRSNETSSTAPHIPDHYGQLMRQVLKHRLLSPSSAPTQTSDAIINMLLDILSGNITSLIDPNDSSYAPASQPLTMTSFFFSSYTPTIPPSDDTSKPDPTIIKKSLFSSEIRLWPVSISSSYVSHSRTPSKSESSRCLRVYRRIINAASWKPSLGTTKILADMTDTGSHRHNKLLSALDSLPHSLDVEEFFAMIHLYSIISKAVIYGHNILEKSSFSPRKSKSAENMAASNITSAPVDVTLEHLIKLLPPGTKSDIANSLLETIEHLSIIWRKKFDRVNTHAPALSQKDSLVDQWLVAKLGNHSEMSQDDILAFTRGRFLLHSTQVIPASPVFNLMTQDLSMPKSIEDVLKQLFE